MTQENNYVPPPPPPQPGVYDQTNVPPAPPPPGVPMGYETPAAPGAVVETNPEARTWGMLAHISSLAGLVIPGVGNWVGPLVVWLVKKDQMPFVNDQGKESLNFQITVLIALLVASPTICLGIGLLILPVIGVAGLVLAIIAGIKANEGVAYRYPFTLRLIK